MNEISEINVSDLSLLEIKEKNQAYQENITDIHSYNQKLLECIKVLKNCLYERCFYSENSFNNAYVIRLSRDNQRLRSENVSMKSQIALLIRYKDQNESLSNELKLVKETLTQYKQLLEEGSKNREDLWKELNRARNENSNLRREERQAQKPKNLCIEHVTKIKHLETLNREILDDNSNCHSKLVEKARELQNKNTFVEKIKISFSNELDRIQDFADTYPTDWFCNLCSLFNLDDQKIKNVSVNAALSRQKKSSRIKKFIYSSDEDLDHYIAADQNILKEFNDENVEIRKVNSFKANKRKFSDKPNFEACSNVEDKIKKPTPNYIKSLKNSEKHNSDLKQKRLKDKKNDNAMFAKITEKLNAELFGEDSQIFPEKIIPTPRVSRTSLRNKPKSMAPTIQLPSKSIGNSLNSSSENDDTSAINNLGKKECKASVAVKMNYIEANSTPQNIHPKDLATLREDSEDDSISHKQMQNKISDEQTSLEEVPNETPINPKTENKTIDNKGSTLAGEKTLSEPIPIQKLVFETAENRENVTCPNVKEVTETGEPFESIGSLSKPEQKPVNDLRIENVNLLEKKLPTKESVEKFNKNTNEIPNKELVQAENMQSSPIKTIDKDEFPKSSRQEEFTEQNLEFGNFNCAIINTNNDSPEDPHENNAPNCSPIPEKSLEIIETPATKYDLEPIKLLPSIDNFLEEDDDDLDDEDEILPNLGIDIDLVTDQDLNMKSEVPNKPLGESDLAIVEKITQKASCIVPDEIASPCQSPVAPPCNSESGNVDLDEINRSCEVVRKPSRSRPFKRLPEKRNKLLDEIAIADEVNVKRIPSPITHQTEIIESKKPMKKLTINDILNSTFSKSDCIWLKSLMEFDLKKHSTQPVKPEVIPQSKPQASNFNKKRNIFPSNQPVAWKKSKPNEKNIRSRLLAKKS